MTHETNLWDKGFIKIICNHEAIRQYKTVLNKSTLMLIVWYGVWNIPIQKNYILPHRKYEKYSCEWTQINCGVATIIIDLILYPNEERVKILCLSLSDM